MKKCYACCAEKAMSEFRKARSDTGYSAKCSQCWRAESAAAALRRRVERRALLIAAGGKTCSRCAERLAPDQFAERAASADGLNSFCRGCDRRRGQSIRSNPVTRLELCSKAKRHYWKNPERARKRARDRTATRPDVVRDIGRRALAKARVERWADLLSGSFRHHAKVMKYGAPDVDAAHLNALFESQNGRCYWLGVPLVPSASVRDPRRPSVDRLDNAKGYVRGNVVLTCQFANLGRSSIQADQFQTFIDELKRQLSHT
jgi:hypothetical protein